MDKLEVVVMKEFVKKETFGTRLTVKLMKAGSGGKKSQWK